MLHKTLRILFIIFDPFVAIWAFLMIIFYQIFSIITKLTIKMIGCITLTYSALLEISSWLPVISKKNIIPNFCPINYGPSLLLILTVFGGKSLQKFWLIGVSKIYPIDNLLIMQLPVWLSTVNMGQEIFGLLLCNLLRSKT